MGEVTIGEARHVRRAQDERHQPCRARVKRGVAGALREVECDQCRRDAGEKLRAVGERLPQCFERERGLDGRLSVLVFDKGIPGV